jgi:geranylgeranyl pyrophosphate synthase
VEEALSRVSARRKDAWPADVAKAVEYGLMGGGKRLRPVLCVTAYTACGGVRSGALYDLAASLELVHAYSLMHDDLPCMDDADLRRGRPATHKVHGEAMTMRAAAAMIPAAALQALEACRDLGCSDDRSRAVVGELLDAAGAAGMVGGQWLDLRGEGRHLEASELDRLHRLKTGALLTAPLAMGAIAQGADEDTTSALRAYGGAVGLAFQIADDLLDATATAEELGKNPSDAELDKSTYVSLYGLEAARAHARDRIDEALGALDSVGLEAEPLRHLARFVIERDR